MNPPFPNGQAAINTLIQLLAGSPATYQTIANVGDITGPTMSSANQDVTSHSTGTPWREKIVTLLDPGTVSFPLFFIPSAVGATGHDGDTGALSQFTSRTFNSWQIAFPDTAATKWQFDGTVSKFSMKAMVAGVLTADIDILLSGAPNFAVTP